VLWAAIFGFFGGGGLFQVVGCGIVFLLCGGWWQLVPLKVVFGFSDGGFGLWIFNMAVCHLSELRNPLRGVGVAPP